MTRLDSKRSYGRKKGKFTYRLENPLITHILGSLAILNIAAWRQPSVGYWDQQKKRYRKHKNSRTGLADISGIMWDGRRLEVECKTENDRQRPGQKIFENDIKMNKGIYIIAGNVDDVLNGLKDYGYIEWDGFVMKKTEKYNKI